MMERAKRDEKPGRGQNKRLQHGMGVCLIAASLLLALMALPLQSAPDIRIGTWHTPAAAPH